MLQQPVLQDMPGRSLGRQIALRAETACVSFGEHVAFHSTVNVVESTQWPTIEILMSTTVLHHKHIYFLLECQGC